MRHPIGGAVAGLALAAVAGAASAACQFVQLAEVPVKMEGLRPTITAKINGHDTTLMVDSGAFFSTISTQAATDFAMTPITTPVGLRVRGVGGAEKDARAVRAADFGFAGAPFRNVDFLVADRVGGGGVSGLIGENILGNLDVEYDLAGGFIRFFKVKDCGFEANLAYWSAGKALSRLPLVVDRSGSYGSMDRMAAVSTPYLQNVVATAKVDGHTIKVTFDSGSPLSVLSRQAAAKAGVKADAAGAVPAGLTYGIYGGGTQTFIAPFDSFSIGDEEVQHTRLRVADIDLGNSDMLLGADFFLSHRILVSSSQRTLYFTYNGGPVFKLDRDPPAAARTATADARPGTAAPAMGPESLKTAADYARRAAGEAARREFPAAIADYGKAIELDPNDAASYRARAEARFATREGALAIADLNQALKLKPDDLHALILRGEVSLGPYPAKAEADFAAAMKAAPTDRAVPLEVASAYMRHGDYGKGITLLDKWLADHPREEDRPRVLIERCDAGASWGRDNERALANCDAALKEVRRAPGLMTSRGLVLLRMGRLDEAIREFDTSVKADPKAVWGLYGRGLAKLRQGDKAGGEADIAAAVAIRPGVPQQARRLGIATEAEAPAPPTAATQKPAA